jgi:hypothetical protein
LSSIARLSSDGLSCATIFFALDLGSTRTTGRARDHYPQIALGIQIDGGRNLEAVGDHRQFGLVDMDLDDLAFEPQSLSSGSNSKPLRPPIFSMIIRGGLTPSTSK